MGKKFTDFVQERRSQAGVFGTKLLGVGTDSDGFVGGGGAYLLLHFDLAKLDAADRATERDDEYAVIDTLAMSLRGTAVGSAYAIPVPSAASAAYGAAAVWNMLVRATSGHLCGGDIFFLHYSSDARNKMGVIAQVVPASGHALHAVTQPK